MDFSNWLQKTEDDILQEYVSRYSIGVNYRTDLGEVLDGFGKLSLGFLSAAMKNAGYHVKQDPGKSFFGFAIPVLLKVKKSS